MKRIVLCCMSLLLTAMTFLLVSCSKNDDGLNFDPSNPESYESLQVWLKGKTYSYFFTSTNSGNDISLNIEFTDLNKITVTSEYAQSREIISKKNGTYSINGDNLVFQVGAVRCNPWNYDIINGQFLRETIKVNIHMTTNQGKSKYVEDLFTLR